MVQDGCLWRGIREQREKGGAEDGALTRPSHGLPNPTTQQPIGSELIVGDTLRRPRLRTR